MNTGLLILCALALLFIVVKNGVQYFAADFGYNRQKDPEINDTDINITLFQAEQPTALAAAAAGTTGILDVEVRADADESGGADVQVLYKITLTPQIAVAGGAQSLKVDVTPVNGDASDAPVATTTHPHPETMDAWQTAAGRVRQV